MKAFAIHIVRRSAYYEELNVQFHQLWMHTKLNNPDWDKCDKDSLYGQCIEKTKTHPRHYA